MHEIDKERFGAFLSQLRKERGMTQKELAEKLFVSDKAVSKWERGLSLPDVALLQPLADLMEVTISELLSGQRIPAEAPLTPGETDRLVAGALNLTAGEEEDRRASRRRWGAWYALGAVLLALELLAVWRWTGFFQDDLDNFVPPLLIVPSLAVTFGAYFCFFVRERLPAFYDENKINFYSDGAFRLNFPGVHFNNSNWPHIVRAVRGWMVGLMALYVPAYIPLYLACGLLPDEKMRFVVLLIACMAVLFGGFFAPIYVVGRKYE